MAEPTVALSNSTPQSETGAKLRSAKRAAIYTRVSPVDQHPET
jgi:DNA integrity scanning protein DisA with diadenylate cyclase activity